MATACNAVYPCASSRPYGVSAPPFSTSRLGYMDANAAGSENAACARTRVAVRAVSTAAAAMVLNVVMWLLLDVGGHCNVVYGISCGALAIARRCTRGR